MRASAFDPTAPPRGRRDRGRLRPPRHPRAPGDLGGRLEIASTPGRGSRFTLVAPLGQAIVPPATPQAAGPAEAEPGSPAGRRLRVLVVDDHALVRRGFATLLAGEPDLEVVGEADNGQRAIELTRQLTPDVIFMDVSMPVMNGIDATRAIHAEFPALRVIGLSMFEDPEQPEAMRQAGAVGYLEQERLRGGPARRDSGGGAPRGVDAAPWPTPGEGRRPHESHHRRPGG